MYGIFAYIYRKNQPFMWVNIPCGPMDGTGYENPVRSGA